MNNDREVMKQALEYLDRLVRGMRMGPDSEAAQVCTALRDRLAQPDVDPCKDGSCDCCWTDKPEQEPVCDKDPQGCWNVRCQLGKVCKNTAPPRREWVGLTDVELAEFSEAELGAYDLCLEVEAKLKEKNT